MDNWLVQMTLNHPPQAVWVRVPPGVRILVKCKSIIRKEKKLKRILSVVAVTAVLVAASVASAGQAVADTGWGW